MKFFSTLIGQKFLMAVSGVCLSVFLLMHLINNLTLFLGPDVFNMMVGTLESVKPLIRIIEFFLLVVFLTHVINAIKLTIGNQKANPKKYMGKEATSSLSSRTMIVSGLAVLVFFVIHLRYIWYTYQQHLFIGNETYYDVILRNQLGYLGHTPTSIFYIIAILFIAFHLHHGFQSAFKTFGVLKKSKWGIVFKFSFIFWAIIPFMFIVIIISIQMGYIQ